MNDELEQGQELEPDLLTLIDEEGEEHQYELADTAEFEEERYVALIPVFDQPEELLEDSGELIILKVVADGEEEFLESIESEEEFDRVGKFFMERLSDTFEFEDPEEE